MTHIANIATEYVLRLPAGSKTMGEVLEAARVVGGDILAWATRREGDEELHHVAVVDATLFDPHFRSTYRRKMARRAVVAIQVDDSEEAIENLLKTLYDNSVSVEYTYAGVEDDHVCLIVRCDRSEEAEKCLIDAS